MEKFLKKSSTYCRPCLLHVSSRALAVWSRRGRKKIPPKLDIHGVCVCDGSWGKDLATAADPNVAVCQRGRRRRRWFAGRSEPVCSPVATSRVVTTECLIQTKKKKSSFLAPGTNCVLNLGGLLHSRFEKGRISISSCSDRLFMSACISNPGLHRSSLQPLMFQERKRKE